MNISKILISAVIVFAIIGFVFSDQINAFGAATISVPNILVPES